MDSAALTRISECESQLKKASRMLVPPVIFGDAGLLSGMDQKVLEQIGNVTCLPGIDDDSAAGEPDGPGDGLIENFADFPDLQVVIAGAQGPDFLALAFLGPVRHGVRIGAGRSTPSMYCDRLRGRIPGPGPNGRRPPASPPSPSHPG